MSNVTADLIRRMDECDKMLAASMLATKAHLPPEYREEMDLDMSEARRIVRRWHSDAICLVSDAEAAACSIR